MGLVEGGEAGETARGGRGGDGEELLAVFAVMVGEEALGSGGGGGADDGGGGGVGAGGRAGGGFVYGVAEEDEGVEAEGGEIACHAVGPP